MLRSVPLLPVIAGVLLLSACASDAEYTRQAARPDCRNVDPPTGSRLVRKADCIPASDAERAAARDQARQFQELQQPLAAPTE